MKILFDFINLQQFTGGAATYTYKVLFALLDRETPNMEVFGLFDSKNAFLKTYDINEVCKNKNIRLVDINLYVNIAQIIKLEGIDSFFISCGQYYHKYNLAGIDCLSLIVIHDLYDFELNDNRFLDKILDSNLTTIKHSFKLWLYNILRIRKNYAADYSNITSFFSQPNVNTVTVSEYTKHALMYYLPQVKKDFSVLYSPEKVVLRKNKIENEILKELIEAKKKYYLLVSANRPLKNARFVIDTFKRITDDANDTFLLTVNYPCKLYKNHINCSLLSESDLEYAYEHAYSLIFASLEEGFGYPPLESIKYGTPVICSNVCSMPDIYENSILYFSPFFKNDLYYKVKVLEKKRKEYNKKALLQYEKIHNRQEKDLNTLIDMIVLKK